MQSDFNKIDIMFKKSIKVFILPKVVLRNTDKKIHCNELLALLISRWVMSTHFNMQFKLMKLEK